MALAFLNPSRSFESDRNAVSFIGHDGLFEIRFLVGADALAKAPQTKITEVMSESDCLASFDAMIPAIHDAARVVYAKRRSRMNTLIPSDFR